MNVSEIRAELERRLHPEQRVADIGLDRYSPEKRYLEHVPQIKCKDGFRLSVQASSGHYCSPRNSVGPWSMVEVGYPSRKVPSFLPYMDGGPRTAQTKTVYGFVPIDLVVQAIADHGGFAPDTSVSA